MSTLSHIFALQAGFNQRLGHNPANMTDEQKAVWVGNYVRALQQELSELIDSTPWKWWKQNQKFDFQNARVEVVDCLHFLVSIAQVLGMSSDDLYIAYCEKNKVNHVRQDKGYTPETKDPNDCKHI